MAMSDKWIPPERFVRFVDMDGEGFMNYEEFYDLTHQFGLHSVIDVDEIFEVLDHDQSGMVPIALFEAALAPTEEDDSFFVSAQDLKVEAFPTDQLVALVAHNNMKPAIMKFVKDNKSFFARTKLVTTGSTGRALTSLGLVVQHLVASGPLGGDQEIGALITQGKVAAVFFFTDPLSSHPHAPDIEALNRICCVHDCMFANNPSTAKTLVYSLQHCPFAMSRLLGCNPEMHMDSSVVLAYKEGQQKVIDAVAEQKKRESIAAKQAVAGPPKELFSLFAPERKSGRVSVRGSRSSHASQQNKAMIELSALELAEIEEMEQSGDEDIIGAGSDTLGEITRELVNAPFLTARP
jgi:methylglyoxal synthase